MARAKRTARAEARRRSRAALAAETGEPIDDALPPSNARRAPADDRAAPPRRMGFMEAFRAAIRPVNVRDDLAALPWIALHSRALWVPLLITLASTVLIVATQGGDVSLFLFAYFIQTPAIGGVFIAGFLAPRASWLLGVVVGLFAAVCYSILVFAFPTMIYDGPVPNEAQAREVALVALVMSPIFGAFLAAGAAWYKRFLRLSAPPRSRPNEKQQRPGDGRTRSASSSQKASVKR